MSAFFNSGDFGIFAQNGLKPMVGIWWREESFVPLLARRHFRSTIQLNIVSCSLKRAFATCQKEEVNTLKVRRQHVEELHPTLRPEAQGE